MTSINNASGAGVQSVTTSQAAATQRRPRRRATGASIAKWVVLGIVSLALIIPLYILLISAFKEQADIFGSPLTIGPGSFTLDPLISAIYSPNFNVIKAYGITTLFVALVNFFCVLLSAPAAYVIGRGNSKWFVALLLLFVSGLFIPSQALLIPVVFVLRALGLMGTIPGFVIFETAATLPVTIFLFTAFVRTIPRQIDEAAAIDGAGRLRTFWSCIFPLMKPVVATLIVLNSVSVWNDFVNPQIILGPSSGLYTVTTGVYAAVGQYSTDYTVVFPTLLLAIAPILVFFIIMQRFIIGGLVAGSTKG